MVPSVTKGGRGALIAGPPVLRELSSRLRDICVSVFGRKSRVRANRCKGLTEIEMENDCLGGGDVSLFVEEQITKKF